MAVRLYALALALRPGQPGNRATGRRQTGQYQLPESRIASASRALVQPDIRDEAETESLLNHAYLLTVNSSIDPVHTMGRTPAANSSNLQINVAAPPNWTFVAGDTVIGSVVRRSSIVAPNAKVTLLLHGRAKTKVTTAHQNQGGNEHYRGRWQLLRTSQILFHGPMHLSPQSHNDEVLSWPFSIDIPEQPDPSVTRGHFRAESFVPFDSTTEAQRNLPGTYFVECKHFGGDSSEGFVEYYLEATLYHTRGSSYKNETAIMPITLRPPKLRSGFSGYTPKQYTIENHVRSQRLVPGMEHAELSFKQKTQKVLHTSKVPVFHFGLEVGSVNALQLDNPDPIPFTLRIIPRDHLTSPIIQDVAQEVYLNWVKMTIKSENKVLAPSPGAETAYNDSYSEKHSLGLERVFKRLNSPVILPCGDGKDEKSLVNLGNMFQLVLTSRGLTAGGKLLNPLLGLYPDFVTYNISHRNNKLDWTICLTVADETITATSSTPLRILAAE